MLFKQSGLSNVSVLVLLSSHRPGQRQRSDRDNEFAEMPQVYKHAVVMVGSTP